MCRRLPRPALPPLPRPEEPLNVTNELQSICGHGGKSNYMVRLGGRGWQKVRRAAGELPASLRRSAWRGVDGLPAQPSLAQPQLRFYPARVCSASPRLRGRDGKSLARPGLAEHGSASRSITRGTPRPSGLAAGLRAGCVACGSATSYGKAPGGTPAKIKDLSSPSGAAFSSPPRAPFPGLRLARGSNPVTALVPPGLPLTCATPGSLRHPAARPGSTCRSRRLCASRGLVPEHFLSISPARGTAPLGNPRARAAVACGPWESGHLRRAQPGGGCASFTKRDTIKQNVQ